MQDANLCIIALVDEITNACLYGNTLIISTTGHFYAYQLHPL